MKDKVKQQIHNNFLWYNTRYVTTRCLDLYKGNLEIWNSGNIQGDQKTCGDFTKSSRSRLLLLYLKWNTLYFVEYLSSSQNLRHSIPHSFWFFDIIMSWCCINQWFQSIVQNLSWRVIGSTHVQMLGKFWKCKEVSRILGKFIYQLVTRFSLRHWSQKKIILLYSAHV